MKTAEEWAKEEGGVFEGEAGELRGFVEHSVLQHIELVRAIQSDAIESTVRRCADVAKSMQESQYTAGGWIHTEILTLIPQKEKKV